MTHCPFCGHTETRRQFLEEPDGYALQCMGCFATGPRLTHPDRAAEAWEKRTVVPSPGSL